MWIVLAALTATTATAADWDALLADTGWEEVGQSSTKATGDIDIKLKEIGGHPCLRGHAVVDAKIDALYDVVTDVPAAKDFSSETLFDSRVLGRDADAIEYYQHLDVPNWTMASDRFWVLRGEPASSGDVRAFRWDRFDWRSKYPDLASDIDTNYSSSVEPDPNWGQWMFQPKGAQTEATYFICSNPGGSLPEWLQKAAATKTLPGTMADVVREAQKRGAGG